MSKYMKPFLFKDVQSESTLNTLRIEDELKSRIMQLEYKASKYEEIILVQKKALRYWKKKSKWLETNNNSIEEVI